MRAACTSVSRSRTGEVRWGAPFMRPCPAQQATLRTATKRTLKSVEAPPILLEMGAIEPDTSSEDDRETVHL